MNMRYIKVANDNFPSATDGVKEYQLLLLLTQLLLWALTDTIMKISI
jgi:hypothetical protein